MVDTVIAVVVTLVAAALFGLSSVMEQRATHLVPERGPASPRLLEDLARQPLWRIAIAVNIAGNILQIVALHFGALALVQPLLVCNLVFAVLISVVARHRAPDRVMMVGVACSAAGIATFIAVARPGGGDKTVSFLAALPLLIGMAAILASCLVAARWASRRVRSLWLALACGVDFGVTAFLLKVVPDTLPQGFADPLRQWPLYVLVVVGPMGFLLNQSAFQAGVLIAPVLAIITTVDPLVSIGIAHLLLDEPIASTPLDLAVESLALVVMIGGIYALAHRAPHTAQYAAEAKNPAGLPVAEHGGG